jgi:hypothetical protein
MPSTLDEVLNQLLSQPSPGLLRSMLMVGYEERHHIAADAVVDRLDARLRSGQTPDVIATEPGVMWIARSCFHFPKAAIEMSCSELVRRAGQVGPTILTASPCV